MDKNKYTLLLGFMAILISGCGGGGGGPTGCDTPLTVDYVNNELTTEILFTSHNITPSNTKIIHEDGNQGNEYDVNRIMLSRIKADDGDTLALSYSTYATKDAPPGSYMAFYIDVDGNINTGYAPGEIGAEALILDAAGESNGNDLVSPYFVWVADSNWTSESILGFTDSTASYFAGCTLGVAIYIPWYQGLAALDLSNANGVMMLAIYSSNYPGTPTTIVDTTGLFSFSFP